MRRMVGRIVLALLVAPAASGAQAGPGGTATKLALGMSARNGDDRSLLGVAFRVGISAHIAPRLEWGADLTIERFGHGSGVSAPCRPDLPCPEGGDAVTLGHGTAVLVLREEGGRHAYLLAGGGITRPMADPAPSKRTYAHVTGGIGWSFARADFGPFLELRFNKYLRARDPMAAWTLPVLVGVRF